MKPAIIVGEMDRSVAYSDRYRETIALLSHADKPFLNRPQRAGKSMAVASMLAALTERVVEAKRPSLNSVRRIEPKYSAPWANVEYPWTLVEQIAAYRPGLHIKTADGRYVEVRSNSTGMFGYSGGELVTLTYTLQGGWRANGKRIDDHQWVDHELDCYREYPTPQVARHTRRLK